MFTQCLNLAYLPQSIFSHCIFFRLDKGVWAIIPCNVFILEEVCACPHAFIKADFSEVLAFKTENWILSLIASTKIRSQIRSTCEHRSQLSEL